MYIVVIDEILERSLRSSAQWLFSVHDILGVDDECRERKSWPFSAEKRCVRIIFERGHLKSSMSRQDASLRKIPVKR